MTVKLDEMTKTMKSDYFTQAIQGKLININ